LNGGENGKTASYLASQLRWQGSKVAGQLTWPPDRLIGQLRAEAALKGATFITHP